MRNVKHNSKISDKVDCVEALTTLSRRLCAKRKRGVEYALNLHILTNNVRLNVHVDNFVDKCVDAFLKRLMEGTTNET